jgi:hypothetical protein
MEDDDRTTSDPSRRAAALRALAARRDLGSGTTESSQALAEAVRVFGGESELVLAAHARWQTHLLARLDAVIENGADDPHEDVLRAVDEVGRVLPGIAALLREHAHDPLLDRARRRLADYVEQTCACGRPHPLVAPAAAAPRPQRCAVRRAAASWRRRVARLARQHGGRRPPVATWQFS